MADQAINTLEKVKQKTDLVSSLADMAEIFKASDEAKKR